MNFFRQKSIFILKNVCNCGKQRNMSFVVTPRLVYVFRKRFSTNSETKKKEFSDIQLNNYKNEENSVDTINDQNLKLNNETNLFLKRANEIIKYKENLIENDKKLEIIKYEKMKTGFSMFILFLGLFTLWIPLYRTICESQGYSVKTNHSKYKFSEKNSK